MFYVYVYLIYVYHELEFSKVSVLVLKVVSRYTKRLKKETDRLETADTTTAELTDRSMILGGQRVNRSL